MKDNLAHDNFVFHYHSVHRPKIMLRLLRKLQKFKANIIIDLEDTLWDPLNSERTKVIKEQGR